MRVVTLVENDKERNDLKSAHGLSLYIEHKEKKLLFDIGPGNQYRKNANKLGIDLKDVDYLVISHGHYDHGRGISKFLRYNKKAKVFVSKSAFGKKYKNYKGVYLPIGIKKPLFQSRITFVEHDMKIENGFKIYADIPLAEQIIKDDSLLMKNGNGYMDDDFSHEIYLVLYDNKSKVLFSGCSHKGIENIIDVIEAKERKPFSAVIAGMHFSHYDSADLRQTIYLEQLGEKLSSKPNVEYYSGHCTGDDAYFELKRHMKFSLNRVKTGTDLKL